LFVQWSKDTEYAGKAATLHVLVIHAMIVILTYGEPEGQSIKVLHHAASPETAIPHESSSEIGLKSQIH